MKISYLLILGIIVAFFVGTDYVFATSVSVPQGTSVPGCETTQECFIPYEVSVPVSGQVTWSNDDSAAHTVTGGSSAGGPSDVFDSSLFMAGTTFSHTFSQAGIYPYFCMVHPWMNGIVNVGNYPSSDETGITVQMSGPLTFYLDVPNQIVRATVEIQDYTPSDGFHFMKVVHLPTNKVMKDFEIYPKDAGNDFWSVPIAYPILESDILIGGEVLLGEYEIQIRSEHGSETGSTKFSILETFVEPEPVVEETPEPVVEETPEPVGKETSEIIEENEKNDSADDQVTIQVNEALIEDLIPILPYLGIVIAGIIAGIIVIIKKSNRNDDEFSEDDEFEDDSIIENSTLTPKFQDMQTGSSSNSLNDFEPHQIIEDKLRRISKLQENKIGDYKKLEEIKKSLIDDGTFTQADNDYLEEKYEEYKNFESANEKK